MKIKKARILYPFLIAAGLIFTVMWQIFFSSANYYFVCAVILILSMLPFFVSFERSQHTTRELTLMASMIALAVVSRAVFYLVPQVKPIAAVVGISGAAMGARRGYIVGAFSMFVSNFIFGQGAWTPFQMVAMGLVGFAFGIVFEHVKINKFTLSVTGFLAVAEKHRRKGCGKALMTAAEAWARAQDIEFVRLNSGSARESAHNFYRTIGYDCEKEQIRFMKKLK